VKELFSFALVCGISGVLAFALARSTSTLRQADSPSPLLAGAHADRQVLSIIEELSELPFANTEWPLYSRIFPFSLLIEHDVRGNSPHEPFPVADA
jgi:hypothetical protein